jgi:hypothetical protein
VKGYPTILKKKQIRFLSFYKSKTYKNAQWTPKYTGSKDYILTGDEVERELKSLYRIVWNVSIRGDNGKVHKLQTHVASIQYWAVVEEFKEFLQYRQERIKNKGRSESMSLKRSYLPGHVPKLEKAIDEFIVDVGNDISIEGRIYDAIKSKVLKEGDNRVDLEEALEKISRKWNPIKKEIPQAGRTQKATWHCSLGGQNRSACSGEGRFCHIREGFSWFFVRVQTRARAA